MRNPILGINKFFDRLFPPAPPAIADAMLTLQTKRVLREVPILNQFGMAVVVIAVIAAWNANLPRHHLAVPVMGILYCLYRAVRWKKLRDQHFAVSEMPALLRRASLGSLIMMISGSLWTISGYFDPDFANRSYLPLFMGVCAIVSCNCFAAIPRTSLTALTLGLLPGAVTYILFGGVLGLTLASLMLIVATVSIRQVREQYLHTIDRMALEQKMREQANTDVLTGLPNRRAIMDLFDDALQSANAECRFGVAVIDLDNFKAINDTHGHISGDLYLCETARRFNRYCAAHDVVARFGGDEFAVLFRNVRGPDDIAARATGLLAALSVPTHIMGKSFRLQASLGYAAWPDHGRTIGDLIAAADMALYAAKREGNKNAQGITNSVAA